MRNNHCDVDMTTFFCDACESVSTATYEESQMCYDEEMFCTLKVGKMKFNISNKTQYQRWKAVRGWRMMDCEL